jgi:hypothetical protein
MSMAILLAAFALVGIIVALAASSYFVARRDNMKIASVLAETNASIATVLAETNARSAAVLAETNAKSAAAVVEASNAREHK